jgi:hypothetical protein
MVTSLDIRQLDAGVTQAQDAEVDDGVSSGPSIPNDPIFLYVLRRLLEEAPANPIIDRGAGDERTTLGRDHIEIGSLLDHRLRMRGSITLQMERDGEFYVASSHELNEYGYGADPISAVQDARNTIAELYWELKENQDRLGAGLAETWEILSELIHEA